MEVVWFLLIHNLTFLTGSYIFVYYLPHVVEVIEPFEEVVRLCGSNVTQGIKRSVK